MNTVKKGNEGVVEGGKAFKMDVIFTNGKMVIGNREWDLARDRSLRIKILIKKGEMKDSRELAIQPGKDGKIRVEIINVNPSVEQPDLGQGSDGSEEKTLQMVHEWDEYLPPFDRHYVVNRYLKRCNGGLK